MLMAKSHRILQISGEMLRVIKWLKPVKCYNRFAFTSAIYKCSYCFINSKANLTLVKVVLN